MKRNSLSLAVCLVIGVVFAARLEATDGLKGAFGKPDTPPTSSATAPFYTPARLEQFIGSIPHENLEPSEDRKHYFFDFKYNDYTIPTLMHFSADGTVIWTRYNLAKLPEDSQPAEYASRMLELLGSNGNYGDYFFRYSADNRMIAICGCFQLRGPVSNADLNEHLINMGRVVVETESLWNPAEWNKNTPQHVGTWHDAQSKMTLVLTSSNSFELAFQGSTMTGQYSIDGDILVLQDADEKIQGNIRFEHANQFTFSINGAPFNFVRQ